MDHPELSEILETTAISPHYILCIDRRSGAQQIMTANTKTSIITELWKL